MLKLWHSLCKKELCSSIEVMVGNRREHPQFSSYKGELYTAYPEVVGGKLALVLLLDNLSNVRPIFITHELSLVFFDKCQRMIKVVHIFDDGGQ